MYTFGSASHSLRQLSYTVPRAPVASRVASAPVPQAQPKQNVSQWFSDVIQKAICDRPNQWFSASFAKEQVIVGFETSTFRLFVQHEDPTRKVYLRYPHPRRGMFEQGQLVFWTLCRDALHGLEGPEVILQVGATTCFKMGFSKLPTMVVDRLHEYAEEKRRVMNVQPKFRGFVSPMNVPNAHWLLEIGPRYFIKKVQSEWTLRMAFYCKMMDLPKIPREEDVRFFEKAYLLLCKHYGFQSHPLFGREAA